MNLEEKSQMILEYKFLEMVLEHSQFLLSMATYNTLAEISKERKPTS